MGLEPQLAFGAGAPFQDNDAGVVVELAGLVLEDVPHQAGAPSRVQDRPPRQQR